MTDNELPEFDFHAVSLSRRSREQLAKIYDSVRIGRKAGSNRSVLQNLLIENCFDIGRGVYIPISPKVDLTGKLPTFSEKINCISCQKLPIRPFGAEYFTNALVIPAGYGTADFDADAAAAPKLRLANIGFLIVTLEHDCTTTAEFEEILCCTRGDIDRSPFAEVDRELCKLADYRGYCIVLSGGRSIHFHFLFSTEHLENVPHDAKASVRLLTFRDDAALLANAHGIYWAHVDAVFKSVLHPSVACDTNLKQPTLWRRTPWGIRTLEQDSQILGLPKGTQIPQLVIREKIRTRAARGSHDYLVAPNFSVTAPVPPHSTATEGNGGPADGSRLVPLLQEECRGEWGGNYPKPVEVARQGDDWVIRFQNHLEDKTPSTIVMGEYRRLMLNGRHDFGDQQFYLADHMSANETIDHLARRTGQSQTESYEAAGHSENRDRLQCSFLDEYSNRIRANFAEPLSDKPLQEIKTAYRKKLCRTLIQGRAWGDTIVVLSGEGIGKTRTLLPLLLQEAQDDAYAHNDDIERFAGFAFRSHEQADRKAEEFRQDGYSVVVWRSFWDHYEEACTAEIKKIIPRDAFIDRGPKAILLKIFKEQPSVFERLERVRKTLWTRSAKFSGHSTILMTTHPTVQTWDTGTITRSWYHPNFDPFASSEEHRTLRDKIRLGRVVLDDPESDVFFHIIHESSFEALCRAQKRNPDWRNHRFEDRVSTYRRLKANNELSGNVFREFESFDELMRLDLEQLDMVEVDYNKFPFGYDQSHSGIYRGTHGEKYYIAPKCWLFTGERHLTVLTTELLVMDAVVGAANRYRDKGGKSAVPFRLRLDHMPGIYPIKIPKFIDRRAQRKTVGGLAQEITESDKKAIVISDMVRDIPAVKTFQAMKGVNGIETNDIFTVMTCLSPHKYAELNVVGQWLGIPNIIQKYYQDQINQAVGRNRGFRQSSDRETKAVIVASARLTKSILDGLSNLAPRVQLYQVPDQPW